MYRPFSRLVPNSDRHLLLGVCAAVWLPACNVSHWNPWDESVTSRDAGVPLTPFTATNGRYFPPFIQNFFAGATSFAQSYPTIASAQADVNLIEVKQLNPNDVKFNEANLSWSADGVYLGYEVVVDGLRKIMLKDLAGNYARELQVIPKGASNFLDGMVVKSAQSYNAGLRWSRDSTRFAFMSNGGVGDYHIYVGAVGAKEAAIGDSHSKDGYATWSPATNEIAFVSARTGNGDIYVIDLSTKRLTRLSKSPAVDLFPDWFPNGKALVYTSGDALRHDLFVVAREGSNWGEPQLLTDSDRDNLRPTVSPDGRYVAFYSNDPRVGPAEQRRWDIVVTPYEPGKTYHGAELRGMVVAEDVVIDLNTGPAWSPDSRKIFYVRHDPSVANPIYAYDLFTGRSYLFKTDTRMNRDLLVSRLGVLSFRAQVGVWDRVFLALTNQGIQLQTTQHLPSKVHYLAR